MAGLTYTSSETAITVASGLRYLKLYNLVDKFFQLVTTTGQTFNIRSLEVDFIPLVDEVLVVKCIDQHSVRVDVWFPKQRESWHSEPVTIVVDQSEK